MQISVFVREAFVVFLRQTFPNAAPGWVKSPKRRAWVDDGESDLAIKPVSQQQRE